MKIGVIADTHGLFDPAIRRHFRNVDHILHAGDIGDRFVIEHLEQIAPVTAVSGNVDDDQCGFPLDVVIELAGQGTDWIHTTLNSYALGDNVENLRFVGSGDFQGTGNYEDNLIVGSEGNDTLVGGVGDDSLFGWEGDDALIGGEGDDFYGVDSAGDQVIEAAGEGTDEVRTALNTYVLSSTLENLKFNGVGDFAVTRWGNG